MTPKMSSAARAWLLMGLVALLIPAMLEARPGASRLLGAEPRAEDSPRGESELDPTQQLAKRQQQVADQFRHLQDVLLRMAELTAGTDPRRAALLKQAVAQSEQRLIGVQLRTLVDLLNNDRLSRAIEGQDDVTRDLDALVELLLSENRADRIRSEKARIRDYLKQLNEIIKRQKGIQGRTAGSGDPQRLADEQGELADKTGGLAREIQTNEQPADDSPGGAGIEDGSEGKGKSAPSEGQGQTQGQSQGQ